MFKIHNTMYLKLVSKLIIVFVTLASLLLPVFVRAKTATDKFPRTANYFLLSGTNLESSSTIKTLSSFDLLVLPAEAQIYNQKFFTEARKNNPDIIILAYVPTVSFNNLYWNDSLHKKLKAGIQSSWWLKNADGNTLSIWHGTSALNLNSGWAEYLANYTSNEIYKTGLWDGIFFDEVNDSISWLGSIDTDNDGDAETNNVADEQWRTGYTKLLTTTRTKLGSKAIVITNGSSNTAFSSYVNGRMFESFPTPWEAGGSWENVTKNYLNLENSVGYNPTFVINSNTNNTGNQTNYQAVRFGLSSALLGGGYFAFDYGTESHAQLWTYDEYNVSLGEPKGEPKDLINLTNTTIKKSVWARDFTNGKVVLNSSDQSQTVKLDGDYEKLHGTQDPTINNGAIISRLTLASKDGLLLLRPIEQIDRAAFNNGAFAHIYNAKGNTKRTGFFAYDANFRGGQTIVRYNMDKDPALETVVADKSQIKIYDDNGQERASFYPYTKDYNLGINFAVGDLENNGSVEIVTGTESGGGPQLRIFNYDGVLIHPGFFAYDTAFRGGVHVALGDVNSDGKKEIITGAGKTGGPHVRIFNKDGVLINPGFFAYNSAFRGGVYVGAGDVDGDGKIEIVTGAGPTGGPHIKVYNDKGELKNEFFSGSTSDLNGAKITISDVDDDGIDEIIELSDNVFTFSSK